MDAIVPDHMIITPDGIASVPGEGTVLATEFPDTELVGRSLATSDVHSPGTVVDTVKLLGVEEIL